MNNNIQLQQIKAMGMRFNWLHSRKAQQQSWYFWRPGHTNRTDYWTKHHCAAHHTQKCSKILTPKSNLKALHASIKRTLFPDIPMHPTSKPNRQAHTDLTPQHYDIWRYRKGVLDILFLATWEYGFPRRYIIYMCAFSHTFWNMAHIPHKTRNSILPPSCDTWVFTIHQQ